MKRKRKYPKFSKHQAQKYFQIIKKCDLEIKPATFLNDKDYPAEFVNENLHIYINIAHFSHLDYEQLLDDFDIAIMIEILCFYIRKEGFSLKCRLDCIPYVLSSIIKRYLEG